MDTNLWSYLAVSGAVDEFDAWAAAAGVVIVTPPSILLEVLYTKDQTRREAIVEALCKRGRLRPPTEAKSMCDEVTAEIRRLHPEWLRRMPDTAKIASLNIFWTKGIWRRAGDTARLAPRSDVAEARNGSIITKGQRTNASNAKAGKVDLRDLNALQARPEPGDALRGRGWRDDRPVALWRVENALLYWHQLIVVGSRAAVTGEDTTFADWVGAYVDLRMLRQHEDEFYAMWLYEVEATAVLRNWVSWAIVWAQMQRRIDASGPIDAQHSAYLCDCDIFLTADRRFAYALQIVADQAPAPIAKVGLVTDIERGVVEAIRKPLGSPERTAAVGEG